MNEHLKELEKMLNDLHDNTALATYETYYRVALLEGLAAITEELRRTRLDPRA